MKDKMIPGRRLRILILIDHYLPGRQAGGPTRLIGNLIEWLGDEFDFRVITANRDNSEATLYPEFPIGMWTKTGKGSVLYLRRGRYTIRELTPHLRYETYDVLLLNSVFSTATTILPLFLRRLGRIDCRHLLLCPRGEFAPEALRVRPLKKKIWLWLSRQLGLYDGITWMAMTPHEQQDIEAIFGREALIILAPNIPCVHTPSLPLPVRQPGAGDLRIIGVGQICPEKNLLFALDVLALTKARVSLDWYGPVADPEILRQVQRQAAALPGNAYFHYRGILSPEAVIPSLAGYDLFFLPSLRENFGHAVFEAMYAGLPVLISDRTPWSPLHKSGAGWDLPLDSAESFARVIDTVGAMAPAERQIIGERARLYAEECLVDPPGLEGIRKIARSAWLAACPLGQRQASNPVIDNPSQEVEAKKQ